jgi:DNA polymerase III alpha subunit
MVMKDKALGNIVVTQYDSTMVEKCGLVKADVLGIKTLTAVSDCIDLVRKRTGKDYLEEDDKGVALIYRLPEDEKIYGDFYNKKTDSAFQFNTDLVKGYIQEFCPLSRHDLSVLTALCRPGALDAPFEDTTATQYYLNVRNGKCDVHYLHDDLEPILKDTNGVIVYQEQVLEILVDICGYSWEESDMVRSAISKKKHDVMMSTFDRIRVASKARGWTDEQSNTLCHQIQAFSNYSFNKSHSRAYSELGYITMYMKHHHMLDWWTSVLNSETSEDKMRKYIVLLGDTIKPPYLKEPSSSFVVKDDKIVAPISVIKGIGPKVVEELIKAGPFNDLHDFMNKICRSKVNIGSMSALIKARAADSFMDLSLPYPESRSRFMKEYLAIKDSDSTFSEDLYKMDSLSIFKMERDANVSFNRSLLEDTGIVDILASTWPGLLPTGKTSIPFKMGKVPVLSSIKLAEGLLKSGHQDEVAFIMMFESSEVRKGVSKKTGRDWCLLSLKLSDGANTVEGVSWDHDKALYWPKDSVVYVRGILKEGWKGAITIDVKEIEKIDL